MENFSIRTAVESDASEVLDFLNQFFHNCDPLELSHPESGHKSTNVDFLLKSIRNESLLLAIETCTSTMAGILIAAPVDAKEAEKLKQIAAESEPKRADIYNILSYVEHKADYCRRFDVNRSLHIHIVCVHPIYRGQQIATRLFKTCLEQTRRKNFKLISVDCTSVYSARIAEALGMHCISSVTYQEYNNYLGKCLFIPSQPHMEIKSFAMRL
jgi:arylalkylamine N-acetyltransferase